MVCVNVHVLRRECTRIEALKEELAWAIDKRFQINCNKMLFKTVIPLRNQRIKQLNKAVLNLKQYCKHCYVTLSNVF